MEITHYFEFNEHEYYSLIAVTTDTNDLKANPQKEAVKTYVENGAGESVEEVLDEAYPNLRTQEYAFMKFVYGTYEQGYTVDQVIHDFKETKNGILLIDGSLI